jgi:hypothetical protein
MFENDSSHFILLMKYLVLQRSVVLLHPELTYEKLHSAFISIAQHDPVHGDCARIIDETLWDSSVSYEVDVDAFEELYRSLRNYDGPFSDAVCTKYDAFLSLYRGNLLPDDAGVTLSWLHLKDTWLRAIYMQMVWRCVSYYLGEKNNAKVIEICRNAQHIYIPCQLSAAGVLYEENQVNGLNGESFTFITKID